MMNLIDKLNQLPKDPEVSKIKSTAEELKMASFSPILLIEIPDLLYMTKNDVITEAKRTADMPESELPDYDHHKFDGPSDFKQKQIEMLYFNFELLTRLRVNNPEAWDYIHELYEDD